MQTRRRAPVPTLLVGWIALLGGACSGAPAPDPAEPVAPSTAELVREAEAASASGDHGRAIQSYHRILDGTPWNTRAKSALVASLVERAGVSMREPGVEGLDRAIEDLRRARELAPDDPVVEANLVQALLARSTRSMDPDEGERFRAEARAIDPAAEAAVPEVRPDRERRLDLAFELLERDQLDAGILRLEGLHRDFPDDPDVARLLAQALVRRGSGLAEREQNERAAAEFARAAELYATPGLCGGASACDDPDARLAHHNCVVAWLNVPRPEEARRALERAESQGIELPELRRELERGGP